MSLRYADFWCHLIAAAAVGMLTLAAALTLPKTSPDSDVTRDVTRTRRLRRVFATITIVAALGVVGSLLTRDYSITFQYAAVLVGSAPAWILAYAFFRRPECVRHMATTKAASRLDGIEAVHRTLRAPCTLPNAYPAQGPREGFVYIVQFSTGVVKVGQTIRPQVRLAKHRRDAAALNVAVIDVWVSSPHRNYLANEKKLIGFCARTGRQVKREYFRGTDLTSVRRFAESLTYVSRSSAGSVTSV